MVTPASIEIDIGKLRNSLRMCVRSIRGYQAAVKEKRVEQKKLRDLVKNPGEYNIEALKRNVEACNIHVEAFENTIGKERKAMNEYNRIIKILEEKKCRLEAISL
jgi:hypothetical protein